MPCKSINYRKIYWTVCTAWKNLGQFSGTFFKNKEKRYERFMNEFEKIWKNNSNKLDPFENEGVSNDVFFQTMEIFRSIPISLKREFNRNTLKQKSSYLKET